MESAFLSYTLPIPALPLGVPMTKTNLLERRKTYIAQRMNKLKEMEASLNVQERKRRTRKLIELGGLVSKAQLDTWDSNTLLGAFLYLKESDPLQRNVWTHKGGAVFAAEKAANVASRRKNP